MPYADAKYPPQQKDMAQVFAALRAAHNALEELDMGWRELDATYVDQLIAGELHSLEQVLHDPDGY